MKKAIELLGVAEAVARFSKDQETKVGALLVDPYDGAIVASGYNGFVRNAPDEKLPKIRPDKYPYMIHAEVNLLINCANHGISTRDKILVCTHSPCKSCARLIQNAGIRTVVFKKWYQDPKELLDVDINFSFKDNGEWVELNFKSKRESEWDLLD